MAQHQQVVTLIGGTGFLGRYAVRALVKAGYTVRVISRYPSLALQLKTAGHIGQVVLQKGDITKPESLEDKLVGSFAVINLVGILAESGRNRFSAVHTEGAAKLARLAKQAGVERFIQISALGADSQSESHYARTKAEGEQAVLEAFPGATILRPSIMFGHEDRFYNKFASMARFAPALPLIGGGKTKFQPVYVVDVAEAIVKSLELPSAKGQIFELGGPKTYSFKEILKFILEHTSRKTPLFPLPFTFASLIGAVIGLLPGAPLTCDQVRLLKKDNVVSPSAKSFKHLNITPVSAEQIVPAYLAPYRRRNTEDLQAATGKVK